MNIEVKPKDVTSLEAAPATQSLESGPVVFVPGTDANGAPETPPEPTDVTAFTAPEPGDPASANVGQVVEVPRPSLLDGPSEFNPERVKFVAPYRFAVKGSAEACSIALYKQTDAVLGGYKRGALRDAIVGALAGCMQQLVKVARPRSSYNIRIALLNANAATYLGDRGPDPSLTHGFNIDVRMNEDPNACPSAYDSLRHFEVEVITKSQGLKHDHEKETHALAWIQRMLNGLDEE